MKREADFWNGFLLTKLFPLFQAVRTNDDFEIATLKFEDFHQMVDGQINHNEVFLKKNDIKTFGFQAFGGVYDDFKQSGPGTLEIEYVKLIN